MAWLSTSAFARLVEDYAPVTSGLIRELCEDGTIPFPIAKRIPGRKQGHWRIAASGIPQVLKDICELTEIEIREVKGKLAQIQRKT